MPKIDEEFDKRSAEWDEISSLEFFERGFDLTSEDRLARFDLSKSPWIKTLCQWFDDSQTEWIYLIQGSQTCKTVFLMGMLLHVSKNVRGPVPCLWVSSIEDEANTFVSGRLKNFLSGDSEKAIRKFKQSNFLVNHASVKVGFSTSEATLRTKPCRYLFGDECSIWEFPVSYVKKRARTFIGKRKGFFATTPPRDGKHDSWIEATSGNFYQWFVPCPICGHFQALKRKNLIWTGKIKIDGEEFWDENEVKSSTHYECEKCHGHWRNEQKHSIVNAGKAVCVDFKTHEQKEERKHDSKTLQVSALYSSFTPWGQLAWDFLEANRKGAYALKIFITDELAEVPDIEENAKIKIKECSLSKFLDPVRKRGFRSGYELYTAAADMQFLGELYWVLLGWKAGSVPTFHILDYGKSKWKKQNNLGELEPFWNDFLSDISSFRRYLCSFPLDSSYGLDAPHIYTFVNSNGFPFVALKECPRQAVKVQYSNTGIDPVTKAKVMFGQKLMEVNSHILKDDFNAVLQRPFGTGAISFPVDTEEVFFKHLTNEKRTEREEKNGSIKAIWEPKYSGAPQHWFSALIYAIAAAEDHIQQLLRREPDKSSMVAKKVQKKEGNKWINIDSWRIENV